MITTDPRQETEQDKIARIIQEGTVHRRTSHDIAGDVLKLMGAALSIPSRLIYRRPPWAFSSARLLIALVIAALAAIFAIATLKPSAPRPLESAAPTERFDRVWHKDQTFSQAGMTVLRDKVTAREYLWVMTGRGTALIELYPRVRYESGYFGGEPSTPSSLPDLGRPR